MRRANTQDLRAETGRGFFAHPVVSAIFAPVILVLNAVNPALADEDDVYFPHTILSHRGSQNGSLSHSGSQNGSLSRSGFRVNTDLERGPVSDPRLTPIHSVEEFLQLLALEHQVDDGRAGFLGAPELGDSLLQRQKDWEEDSRFYSASPHQGEMNALEAPDDPFYNFDSKSSLREDLFDPIDLRINFDEPPSYVSAPDQEPLLGGAKPEARARHEVLKGLFNRQFFRHTRRLLKKYWRRQFKESTSMRQEFYDERLAQINNIGRVPEDFDDFNADYYLNRVRDDVFADNQEGEREMALVEFGPLRINDEGSVDFDLPGLLGLGSKDSLQLSFDPEAQEKRELAARALYSGDHIKFKPGFRLKVDPFRAVNGTYEDILRSYGGSISVEFYSDILRRKLFETELEGKFRQDGDFALFFNVVVRGRN